MSDRAGIAWLHRRVGWGLAAGELDELESAGIDAVVDRLVDPDGEGRPANPDPWAAMTFTSTPETRRDESIGAVRGWLIQMVTTPRPLEEWMRWYWHGHLVSSLAGVNVPLLLVNQLRTYGQLGLGSFRELLRATTTDPAMLAYLNGNTSVGAAPNENYGRELMELFALGVGGFTETDVKAAAIALTGWTIDRQTGGARFVPRRHDDAPQSLLGVSGVHDVDSVIDAVLANESCGPFVAGRLARAILGANADKGLIERLGRGFADGGFEIRPLVRQILEAGLDGASKPMVKPPTPWLVGALRATGASGLGETNQVARGIRASGQIPMAPPNVSGWPGDQAWLGAAATIARANLSAVVADSTPAGSVVLDLAAGGDDVGLADGLGCPNAFGEATRRALADARNVGGRPGVAPLTVALASPEVVQA